MGSGSANISGITNKNTLLGVAGIFMYTAPNWEHGDLKASLYHSFIPFTLFNSILNLMYTDEVYCGPNQEKDQTYNVTLVSEKSTVWVPNVQEALH